jgi:hypothetical protein
MRRISGDGVDLVWAVVYNGYVNALPKRIGPGSLACRCVKR